MKHTTFLHSTLLLLITFLIFLTISTATDILAPNQSLTDNQTLVSVGGLFELGFFSGGNLKNRYLGIWYKKISPQTVVWVANRDNPITDSSGVVRLGNNGTLVLVDQSSKVFWSSIQSNAVNPVAQILDNGNLVVREETDENSDDYKWQSFDYPTNTLLPGMKLGWDLKTGLNRFIRSWKSPNDPAQGDYSFKLDLNGSPEAYLWSKDKKIYRSGPWNGIQFSGVPEMRSNTDFNFKFVSDQDEKYYSFNVNDKTIASLLVVNDLGKLQRYTWLDNGRGWYSYWDAPKDQCDNYWECGPYGICDTDNSPVCNCVHGFVPKNQRDWDLRIGDGGCVRRTTFECNKNDGFLVLKGMKLPDSGSAYVNSSMDLKECRGMCKKNCSCTAYANSDISGRGSGCVLWFEDLVDLRQYSYGGQNLYVRVAASELGNSKKSVAIIVTCTVIAAMFLLGLIIYIIRKRKIRKRKEKERVKRIKSQELPLFDVFSSEAREKSMEKNKDELELPLIDLDVVVNTTDNFSSANKLGQGGFGSVYKGTLADGEQIAVKRLSRTSGQGVEEFKNEVKLIAKLQHRNLVRLLGCCIEGEEKMLIYEYMPNKSLDFILFDKTKCMLLDWRKRFNIVSGIARGLLYLHQDSRLRIIHRDLKASNILLDGEMNPKISDFGMARIFGGDETEGSTRRIVGTYGYMSPEYAMDGLFSVKSDVYSYGILVLEILSGQKNRGVYRINEYNLLGHVWKLWEEGKVLELMDPSLENSCSTYEVLRCIQVALLCVQEHAEDRPTMSSVLLMLSSETVTLPQPKHPGFSLGKTPTGFSSSSNNQESCTSNQLSVTMLEAR